MDRRTTLLVAAVAFSLVVLVASLAACGNGDPYTGKWTGPNLGTFTIQKANDGWWSIDPGVGGSPVFFAADVNGELQTPNGRTTFKRSGDKLAFTAGPGALPVELSRQ